MIAAKALLRQLASRWPLLVALLFAAYAYLLIGNVYRSQGQLKEETDQHVLAVAKRQVTTVTDLITERRNAVVELAESPEVAHYFTNKALGMSLRYGLKANLFEIEERFLQRIRRPDLRGERIFRRIVLFDNLGHVLVDLAPGDGPISPSVSTTNKPNLNVDIHAGKIMTSAKVIHKGAQVGIIVAQGDTWQLSRDLMGADTHGIRHEFLIFHDGSRLPNESNVPSAEFVRAALSLPEGILVPANKLAASENTAGNILALRTVVPDAGFSLLTLRSEDALYGQLTSRFFLYFASTFPLLVLAATFMFGRMRRAEGALIRSEQRFHTIFNNIKETVFILNAADGCFIEANPSVLEVFGYQQDEVPGLTAINICAGEEGFEASGWSSKIAKAAAGEPQSFEWHARHKEGTLFWIGVNARHAQIDNSDCILVVTRDITLRKEQESALLESLEHERQLNKQLEDAQNQLLQSEKMASIGQLAAGVAHEINNPIGFVNSNLSTLETYVDALMNLLSAYEHCEENLPQVWRIHLGNLRKQIDVDFLREDIRSLLTESMEGTQRVRQIVADLKDFSHVDQTGLQYFNLEAGLDSTLNVVWNELKYKAEVVKDYAGIPEIECMASQLNQVFMNLLVNAAQAIPERGRIIVRSGFNEDHIWVEIEDNGTGIDPEHMTRIFDPFFTTKPVGKGTGLGLSLSFGIVRKHRGEITVRSRLGEGSIFRVCLPRHPQETENSSAE